MLATQPDSWDVRRRNDGAVLVMVHSCDRQGRQLPDAVFSFRSGDPQYDYWESQLQRRMRGETSSCPLGDPRRYP